VKTRRRTPIPIPIPRRMAMRVPRPGSMPAVEVPSAFAVPEVPYPCPSSAPDNSSGWMLADPYAPGCGFD